MINHRNVFRRHLQEIRNFLIAFPHSLSHSQTVITERCKKVTRNLNRFNRIVVICKLFWCFFYWIFAIYKFAIYILHGWYTSETKSNGNEEQKTNKTKLNCEHERDTAKRDWSNKVRTQQCARYTVYVCISFTHSRRRVFLHFSEILLCAYI